MLIIGAMALILVFGVGGKANETAFRLGRRALLTADSRLAGDSLGAIISGVVLAPADQGTGAADGFAGRRFVGVPAGFRTDVIMDVATPCAPAGSIADLRVELVRARGGVILTCRVGEGAPIALLDLGDRPASFSYSLDGLTWTDGWSERQGFGLSPTATPHERRLYVRLASSDGSVEIVGRASSDRPELQAQRQKIGPDL